jgi:hypothetical protein
MHMRVAEREMHEFNQGKEIRNAAIIEILK